MAPDFGDEATEATKGHFDDCLALVRIRIPTGISATECDECGDAIPEGRRVAVPGCRLCRECQEALE